MFKIFAKNDHAAEILIYEMIGYDWWTGEGVTLDRVREELEKFENVDQIDIRINSPGGDVFEGVAIYNILKNHKAKKTVYIDGIAASIASIIALCGDEVVMGAGAMLMIHEPWTYTAGNRYQLKEIEQSLEAIASELADIYVNSSDLSKDEVFELMKKDSYLGASYCIEHGFATSQTSKTENVEASMFKYPWMENASKEIVKGLTGEKSSSESPLNNKSKEPSKVDSKQQEIRNKVLKQQSDYFKMVAANN